MATKKSKTRRKRGGKNWNCTCKLANAGVVAAATQSPVGKTMGDAAGKIQTAFRGLDARKKLKKLQTAAAEKQKAAAAKIQAIKRGNDARKLTAALRTGKGKSGGRRRKTRKMSRRRRRR